MGLELLLIGVGITILIIIYAAFTIFIFKRLYQTVPAGEAILVSGIGNRTRISFGGALVYPAIHRAERIDITVKRLEIVLMGEHAPLSQDGLPVDVSVSFCIRINPTEADILHVAQQFGAEQAGDLAVLQAHFGPGFASGLCDVIGQTPFARLYGEPDLLRDRVTERIGQDLSGFVLESVDIAHLAMSPDPENPSDGFSARKALRHAVQRQLEVRLGGKGGEELLKRLAAGEISPEDAANQLMPKN